MHMSKRSLAGAVWVGTLLVLAAPLVRAQDVSIGSIGVSTGIASGMGGQSSGSASAAMGKARGAGAGAGGGIEGDGTGGDAAGGPAGAGGAAAGKAAEKPTIVTAAVVGTPLKWHNTTGEQYLAELLAGGRKAPARKAAPRKSSRRTSSRRRRTSRQQSAYSRRVNAQTAAQRKKETMAKYQVPPRNWLSHYLKEDRYKVTTGIWKFVTTPNDPYYYAPSAVAIGRKPAGELIGFRTWQDATLAGYRPDPNTKPAPGAQLAQLARYTRGPMLARYIEYVYNGHVRPDIFSYNFQYTMQVAQDVTRHAHTRPHTSATVNQAIGATMGEASPPTVVGISGVSTGDAAPAAGGTPGIPNPNAPTGGRPMTLGDGPADKRADNYDEGKKRFGNLKR